MEPTEYEQQWTEGEEPGPITDAVLKAKRKEAGDSLTADEKEFAEAFDAQPDAEEPKKEAKKP